MDELDRQYSPSQWSKRLGPEVIVTRHIQLLGEATAHAQKVLKSRCKLSVSYDEDSGQVVDIYDPALGQSGDPNHVLIYFHGGYWSAMGVEQSGFLAENCGERGIVTVAVGYDLAPKVSMTTIVDQCRRACVFVVRKFPKSRIFVCGHSAGGHLSATMMYTDWSQYGIDTQPLSGAILLSGVYDLAPLQRTYVNDDLKFTQYEIQFFSPQKNLEQIRARLPVQFPCLVAVGGDESDEFRRQTDEFHQGLCSVGVASTKITLEGIDHFDILEKLTDTNYILTQKILDFMSK